MALDKKSSIDVGLFALYAEDMYIHGELLPRDEPRIAQRGWTVVARIVGTDSILPEASNAKSMELGTQTVFYGYLARNNGNPTEYIAAIRGTAGTIEWIIDATGPGDVVVIAGKGHETGQTTGTTTVEFDDRVVTRSVLAGRGAS